jgi:nucleoside-diphosphate-sugar epimerase
MKIAVTGASGFVGHYVVSELLDRSLPVTLVARDSSKLCGSLNYHNVTIIDFHNPPSNSYELMGSPDVLIHLAWSGLPNYMSFHHFEEELPKQFQFLKKLIQSGLKNLLVTGTCFEYGMQSGSLSEDLRSHPTTSYGFAKDMLRCQLEYLQQVHPFNFTWTRLFYLYGDGQAKNSLFPQLRRAVEQNEGFFNMSGGEQLRDYLPVAEVAKYLVSLATMMQNYGIINVCSGNPISIRKLVEDWISKNGWSIDLNLGYYPYPYYEPMAFWGDCHKLDRCMEAK